MIFDVLFENSSIVMTSLRAISAHGGLEEPEMLGDDLLCRRAFQPEVANLEPQALLQVARRDANRVERLQMLQRTLDLRHGPVPHRRDLFDRRHEVAIVIEIADNRGADLPKRSVIGLHGQLPQQMVRQRRGRREGILDRRQFFTSDCSLR